MVKNNAYYELFASITVPNPDQVGYWVDLGANSKGKIIKVYNNNTGQWVKVIDAGSADAVSPFIGSNGNWWVDNRDTGIPAAGKNPYVGDDDFWWVFDAVNNKYVNSGVYARGKSAYDIAVDHGFKGTEEEWLDYLRRPALDAAEKALAAADKADKATEESKIATVNAINATEAANAAADRSNEIASHPPKIVNEEWYMWDEATKEYKPTGIKAIGDEFTIVKTYPSIAAMEADYNNPEVGIGQFVMIDTGDVEDPEDAQLYLKGDTEWKFIADLSGMQGIQGLSAYQVAVQEGFVGTQAEWVQSLKQPALDAAAEALEAKAQVEATEAAVKEAEAARVIEEGKRVDAETVRESNEDTRKENEANRIAAENIRVSSENTRITAETERISNENTRKSNETTRISNEEARKASETERNTKEAERLENESNREAAEAIRVTQEQGRVDAEKIRVTNENERISAEADRKTSEDTRIANETTREENEAIRETQETERQTNTAAAITAVNEAKKASETATTNANTAAANANTQANRAKEYSDNPPKIEEDRWWVWDEVNDVYVNTGVFATGEPGKSPIIQNGTWWVYNNETSKYEDTLIPVTTPYQLTKEKVEAVLTGEITSHHHDAFYYTETEIDQKLKDTNDKFDNYLAKDNKTGYVPLDDYNPTTKKYVDDEVTRIDTELGKKVDTSSVGVANGIAQLDTTGKVPASQLPSFVDDVLEYDTYDDFPVEGEAGKIYIAIDTNMTYRWSGTQYTMIASSLALGETSSTAYPGDKGKANADKLATIESGAQVNVIEKVNARGADLTVLDKRVIVPEDIAISDTEPTGDELIWINTAEDYLFEFGGYTKEDADNKFVAKEAGKGLSTNDYTNEEKASVANKIDTVTEVGDPGNVVSNLAKLGTELRVYKTTMLNEAAADAKYSTIVSTNNTATQLQNNIDGKVSKAGDTMTGTLTLDSPSNAGKSYVKIARDGKQVGYLGDGATGENQAIIINNSVTNKSVQLKNTGELTYDGKRVLVEDGSVPFTGNAYIKKSGNAKLTFSDADNTELGYIGRIESTEDGNGIWVRNYKTGNTLRLQDDGAFTYKGNDIYHRGNRGEIFPTYRDLVVSNSANVGTVTVGGDKDTFYPVHIGFTGDSLQTPKKCWIQRTLSTPSPDWDGNHSSGNSSLNIGWEFRAGGWDGNGNYWRTMVNYQIYAPLVARVWFGSQSWIGLVVWLRGGGALYNIITDSNIRVCSCTDGDITVGQNTMTPIALSDISNYNRGTDGFGNFSIGNIRQGSYGIKIQDQLFANGYSSQSPSPSIVIDKAGSDKLGIGSTTSAVNQIIRYGACIQSNADSKHAWKDADNTYKHYFDGDLYAQGGTAKVWHEGNFDPTALKDHLAYWYEDNDNQSTTTRNTGGNRAVIESLKSKFKRCIAKPYGDDAALISFCNETNSLKWPDNTDVTWNSGNKEQWMVYFPKYYHKTVEMSSGIWRTYISEIQLDDDYVEEPEMLLSVFEAYNNSGVLVSDTGKESTASQTIATFVTQAKANGPLWGIGDYRSHATIARMFCAYYGTTNISTSNSAIPCSGGTKRYNVGKTGGTLTLGNADGKLAVRDDAGYYSTNFLGLEDCYYGKWEFLQGVNVQDGRWIVYDGGSFPDKDVADLEVAGATNIRIAGISALAGTTAAGSGWTKSISHGRYGDVVPTAHGGSESTYYSDYHWYNPGWRIVFRSGYSADGSRCGVFVASANGASSDSWTNIGSRLAFYGDIVVVDSNTFKKTQV